MIGACIGILIAANVALVGIKWTARIINAYQTEYLDTLKAELAEARERSEAKIRDIMKAAGNLFAQLVVAAVIVRVTTETAKPPQCECIACKAAQLGATIKQPLREMEH